MTEMPRNKIKYVVGHYCSFTKVLLVFGT